jgi:hypothetical protein
LVVLRTFSGYLLVLIDTCLTLSILITFLTF